jgi:hypothetical protein
MRRNLLEVFGGRDPVARRAAIEELGRIIRFWVFLEAP